MCKLKQLTENYNYYPRTMIRLSEIAYKDIGSIPNAVKTLGFKVVWGPAEQVDVFDVSYSLMYIAMRSEPYEEYTVVIRGTNMESWESWVEEDFNIATTKPFRDFVGGAPNNARISQGTCNGMTDLLRLRDKNTREVAVDFLRKVKPSSLFITGHSLGGTLAPPIFAYLNYALYGGGLANNMALWTFAGLTPGNNEFNDYFNSLLNPSFKWRLHNSLDIAPLCWWSLESIKNIYKPYLDWGALESTIIEDLFDQARGNGYAQPLGDKSLLGEFDPTFVDNHLWAAQAMHQHSTITYKSLVDKAYPSPRTVP